MKINLCVYSDQKFEVPRKALVNFARECGFFFSIFEYDREWLESTDFYTEHAEILSDKRKGDGWCLWKPFVILESLNKIEEGEILLYMDCTDTFSPMINLFLEKFFTGNDIMLSQMGESPNSSYCKRDTFIKMGCDESRYWNSIQLEAGIIAIKKNERTVNFVKEYLQYCSDPVAIKDDPNVLGQPNLNGFVRHMYDQAILTNLKAKHSIIPSTEIRYFVECNMWEALHFWEGGRAEFNRKVSRIFNQVVGVGTEASELWINHYLKKIDPSA